MQLNHSAARAERPKDAPNVRGASLGVKQIGETLLVATHAVPSDIFFGRLQHPVSETKEDLAPEQIICSR